jgi:hypothetical protein
MLKKRFRAKQEKNQAINSSSNPTCTRFQAKQETIFAILAQAPNKQPRAKKKF